MHCDNNFDITTFIYPFIAVIMKNILSAGLFLTLLIGPASAQTVIAAKNARKFIGRTVTFCEKIFDGKLILPANTIELYAGGYRSDEQLLTVIIPASSRRKFSGRPEADYLGKDVTITGKLILYRNKPAVVVTAPGYLKPVLVDNMRNPIISVRRE